MSGSYILSAGGTGFVFGTSLIFSIGPQNLYLIRAGALTKAPLLIATVGYLSEFLLVTAGLVSVGPLLLTICFACLVSAFSSGAGCRRC